jgi:hypothetical protein
MGRYSFKPSIQTSSSERFLHSCSDAPSIKLDGIALAVGSPAAEVAEEPGVKPDGGLSLFGFAFARGSAVKHAPLKVNPPRMCRWMKSGRTDSTRSCSGVESDKNKSSNVLSAFASCGMALLNLSKSPGSPNQTGGFASGKPTITSGSSLGEQYSNKFPAKSLASMVADCGT